MTLNDKKVNTLFGFCNELLEDIMKSVHISNKDKKMYLTTLATFITFYGRDSIDTIMEAYKNTQVINKIMLFKKSNEDPKTRAKFCRNYITKVKDGKISLFIESDKIILKKPIISQIEKIEIFSHEMNHAIKSQNKCITYNDSSTIAKIRNGIKELNIDNQHNETIKNRNIEELFNQIQTLAMLNIINFFGGTDIKNKTIRTYLKELSNSYSTYNSLQYAGLIDMVKRIYLDEKFQKEYDTRCVDGNIQNIYDNFNYYVGDDSFDSLSSAVDSCIESNYTDQKQLNKVAELNLAYINSKRR